MTIRYQSNWLQGLIYAESLGVEGALKFIRNYHCLTCGYSFIAGMHDYIKHARTRLGVENE